MKKLKKSHPNQLKYNKKTPIKGEIKAIYQA